MDPMWVALWICLGVMAVGGILGALIFYVFFKPLYREDR